MNEEFELLGDKGYQGIKNIHTNSRTPLKKIKNKKLNQANKKLNRPIAKSRIIIENIHRSLNIFRIFSSYRNRRRRFGLRFNLIAGIYNYELSLKKNYRSPETFARGLMSFCFDFIKLTKNKYGMRNS